MISRLSITNVGPAQSVALNFGSRMSVVTGDNGVGKTFLVDCAWFLLTGGWPGVKGLPRDARVSSTIGGVVEDREVDANFELDDWTHVPSSTSPVVYVRVDGGVSMFDPLKGQGRTQRTPEGTQTLVETLDLDARQLYDGIRDESGYIVCRGLIDDLLLWQLGKHPAFEALSRVLVVLSSPDDPIKLGPPKRLWARDVREVPTIVTSTGTVPITVASAGARRVLGLAYALVWTWFEHRVVADVRGVTASPSLVVLFDEVEAHLHPAWQRALVPALLAAVRELGSGGDVQLLATTHSPLVLASLEPIFDGTRDRLFHVDVENGAANLKEVPWVNHGDASNWLTSDVFGLAQARSIEAQRAIEAAEAFMAGRTVDLPPDLASRDTIHAELVRVLGSLDPFWPRWIVTARSVR